MTKELLRKTVSRREKDAMKSSCFLLLFLTVLAEVASPVSAFVVRPHHAPTTTTTILCAAANKNSGKANAKKSRGGGFGGAGGTAAAQDAAVVVTPVKADKTSLEQQWDVFASVTDLELKPLGDPADEDYDHFEVVDVFVRSGGDGDDEAAGTGWFRIGKVCVSDETPVAAALTLQKGLILWTAVHMRREFMALGKASATSLELGHVAPASIYMGCDSDGPLSQEEADGYGLTGFEKAPPSVLRTIQDAKSFGFRPDWNPPGFTYKRREKAALKSNKPKSKLEEILEAEMNNE